MKAMCNDAVNKRLTIAGFTERDYGIQYILDTCYLNRENYKRDTFCLPEYTVCLSEHPPAAVLRCFSMHYKQHVINLGSVKR